MLLLGKLRLLILNTLLVENSKSTALIATYAESLNQAFNRRLILSLRLACPSDTSPVSVTFLKD